MKYQFDYMFRDKRVQTLLFYHGCTRLSPVNIEEYANTYVKLFGILQQHIYNMITEPTTFVFDAKELFESLPFQTMFTQVCERESEDSGFYMNSEYGALPSIMQMWTNIYYPLMAGKYIRLRYDHDPWLYFYLVRENVWHRIRAFHRNEETSAVREEVLYRIHGRKLVSLSTPMWVEPTDADAPSDLEYYKDCDVVCKCTFDTGESEFIDICTIVKCISQDDLVHIFNIWSQYLFHFEHPLPVATSPLKPIAIAGRDSGKCVDNDDSDVINCYCC